ncbi:CEP126 isoform 2, partial [Pongo abelii]
AHIPLSQRRKAVFRKPVPPLEEALKQIQESNLKSEVNLPFSRRPTINWRSIPACPAVSTPDPYLPDQLSPPRVPLQSHHFQILPSYPTVSPTRQPHILPIHPSVPSTLPKTFAPVPLLSYPIKYRPRPPTPATSSISSSFPRLPAPIPSCPPGHLPHPPQSSPIIPDPESQNKLFYKTFRPKHFLPAQHSTAATLMPTLVRHSLPAQLVVSPTPLEPLPVLKSSCLSSHPPHPPVPTLSYVTPLPAHPASLDPFQSVQQSVPQATALSNQPETFADHPPASVLSLASPCHSPSSSLPSSPSTSTSFSSACIPFSSSSSILSSSSTSSSTSSSLPPSSIPLFSSPLHSSSSPGLPPTYLAFPSPISPVSSSFMISSSFPPILHSPSVSTSPSPFIPIHPFNPPHWGKKVEKRREESGVEKKGIEKKVETRQL